MAEKQYSKIGKTYSVISDITVAPIRMSTQDISNWVDATNAARDVHFPRRRKLIELYDNISADGKVQTVITKRKSAITNKSFVFYEKGKEGKKVERIQNEIIDTPWFDELLELVEVEEALYGHVAIEIVPGSETPIEGVIHLPHANISPEKGLILPNYMDTENGILFRGINADPKCKKFILEFGKTKNLGLLWSMSQYVIYKRGGFGDWAQFAELFGMPFRVGKYNPLDPESRRLLNTSLREMGGAGYATIPEGTTLEFIQSNFGSGQSGIFKDLIQACNDEIAQIGLGGTMTTEDGASKAQGEVHKEGEHEISASRLKKILKFLNGPFRNRLSTYFNYPEAANGVFTLEGVDLISLKDRIEIDSQLNNIIEIEPKYFYDKYNVPAPQSGMALKKAQIQPPPINETPPGKDPVAQKKKSTLSARLNAFYTTCACSNCAPFTSSEGIGVKQLTKSLKLSFDSDVERIAKLITQGLIKPGSVDLDLVKKTATKLMQGITKGYITKPSDFTAQDEALLAFIKENIFVFSGFKTEKFLRQASELLLDAEGKIKPFNEFKADILALNETYNVRYLTVEYNHAISSAQMASKWLSFQKLKADFPNLKYQTAGDDRVRPAHAVLNGLIIPMNDPKVDLIYPVKDFGCRCDMDATDEEANDSTYNLNVDLGPFKGNVGKTGIVFPESHPYYEASKKTTQAVNQAVKSIIPK